MRKMRRCTTLVIHPGALGDVLLSVPAIRALRARFPANRLGLMARGDVGCLLRACGEVDHVFPLERRGLASLFAGLHAMDDDLREWLEDCDAAVCWMSDSDRRLQHVLRALDIRHVSVGSPRHEDGQHVHQTDKFLATIGAVTDCADPSGTLKPGARSIDAGLGMLADLGISTTDRLMLFHPGGGSMHKCCRPTLFVEVISHFRNRGFVPVLLQGPADDQMVLSVLRDLMEPTPVLVNLPLRILAGVMSGAHLFVGHDSGVTHLAAGLGIPAVALFGPTDQQRWAPRGPRAMLVSGHRCLCEDWNAVRSCQEKRCLDIPGATVINVCTELLGAQNRKLRPREDGHAACSTF